MSSKQAGRAEKTQQAILAAAAHLFGRRAFEDVTMREIAKQAGCSHTTIYIYFKDKEELLGRLAAEPLLSAKRQLEVILTSECASPEERLRSFSREFIRFALDNRTLYPVFFTAKPTRVDEDDPKLEIQRLRNDLFNLVGDALAAALEVDRADDGLLAYIRSYFFLLHGIIASYATSEERVEALFDRLEPTFDLALRSMLSGIKLIHQSDR